MFDNDQGMWMIWVKTAEQMIWQIICKIKTCNPESWFEEAINMVKLCTGEDSDHSREVKNRCEQFVAPP